MNSPCETSDLLVFSHLRWDFLVKRPQHLMSRYAQHRRVFYFEDPVFGMTELPRLHLKETSENVLIVIPYLPTNIDPDKINSALVDLVDELIYEEEIIEFSLLYYNSQAYEYSKHLIPKLSMYDCIEVETQNHNDVIKNFDLMFVSGMAMYETKKQFHHNIHLVANSLDYAHFSQARGKLVEPDDQIDIAKKRIGYYGSLDETFDFKLLEQIATLKSQYQFVIIGPAVRTDPRTYPRRPNIHYLGKKDYHTLPLYLSGWDCIIMPLHVNERTKNIAPSKTYEFLASGKPLVSIPLNEYAYQNRIECVIKTANTAEDFSVAIDEVLPTKKDPVRLDQVDHFLKDKSWECNFKRMVQLEHEATQKQEEQDIRPKIIHPLNISASGAF